MSDFQLFFAGAGLAFVCYCIGRGINNIAMLFFDPGPLNFFMILSLPFYLVGIPAALALHLVQSFPNNCIIDAAVKEEREKWEKRCESEVQTAVRLERDRVYDDLSERYTFVPKK